MRGHGNTVANWQAAHTRSSAQAGYLIADEIVVLAPVGSAPGGVSPGLGASGQIRSTIACPVDQLNSTIS